EGDRRLARTESLEIHPRLHFLQPGIDPAFQLADRKSDRELLVQFLGKGLADLHVFYSFVTRAETAPRLDALGSGICRDLADKSLFGLPLYPFPLLPATA